MSNKTPLLLSPGGTVQIGGKSSLFDASASTSASDSPYTLAALVRTKPVSEILAEVENTELGEHAAGGLKKCLTRWDVLFYGVGSTVGAGIFVITGQGALSAGPAVAVSFLVAAICCFFSAMSYAEFAARVPVSGSAYTFTYCSLGELAGWFVGWNLTLEYAISAAAVARGFSSNLILFIENVGGRAPTWVDQLSLFGLSNMSPLSLVLCLLCTAVLILGVKESARLNMVITITNVSCILFIVILGSIHLEPSNWVSTDTSHGAGIPDGCKSHGFFPCGINGVMTGAAQVFFSFIGFDSVTTLAEEVSDPKRDIPFGVVSTLIIATCLYVSSSLVVTGMVPWNALNSKTPLASAFTAVGVPWATTMIAFITVTALAVNTLCSLFGQPRIFYRMSKDGLLFSLFSKVHPETQAPIWGTIITGIVSGLIALIMDLDALSEMISIGTLMAFSTVCIGVVLLRYEPPAHRPAMPFLLLLAFILPAIGLSVALRNLDTCPIWIIVILALIMIVPVIMISRLKVAALSHPLSFECPLVPYLPLAGVFCNMFLICSLNVWSYVRMLVWTFVGMSIYFLYGIKNSKLYRPTFASSSSKLYAPLDSSL